MSARASARADYEAAENTLASLVASGKAGVVFSAPWRQLIPVWDALSLPCAERQAGWNLVIWDASGWAAVPPGPVTEIWLTAPGTVATDPRYRASRRDSYDNPPHTAAKYAL